METVRVELGQRSYDILIGQSLLDRAGELIRDILPGRAAAIVTNSTIAPLYAERLTASLAAAGYRPCRIVLPDGERYKTLDQVQAIYSQLLAEGLDRSSFLIALGGGVIGDMTGFAAATFMRGIPFVQVPTTLLAQVDSSIGGKTGVNLRAGKNLVGAFHQPRRVLIDPAVLETLPDRELRSGMAEVIKTAVIQDREFFEFLEATAGSRNADALGHGIATCCRIKAGITAQDETEQGMRAILNFGHTIGHAIEALTGYTVFTHGEAVAIGMAAMARISHFLGLCSTGEIDRIEALLKCSGLPTGLPDFPSERYVQAVLKDKKKADGSIKMVFLKETGAVCLRPVEAPQLHEFFTYLLQPRTP